MQQLSFPLKVHVRRNGKRVIFVLHEQYGSCTRPEVRVEQDDTRHFCNWIRTTFPDIPTEYKATTDRPYYRKRRRHDPAEQHFVAYDLTPTEFMMIKLAFSFETIKVRFTKQKMWHRNYWTKKRYQVEAYHTPGYFKRWNVHPSKALLERMAKNPGKYRKLTRNRQK